MASYAPPLSPTSPSAAAPPASASAVSTAYTSTSTGTDSGPNMTNDKNAAAPSMSEEEISALLTRLSQKDTVTSVLILSRHDGAIIRATGDLAHPVNLNDEISPINGAAAVDHTPVVSEYAGVVWRFIKASEELIVGELGRLGGLSGGGGGAGGERGGGNGVEDDLKLVRIRTRRGELVVVPDGKFILVVVHDTPSK